jgi:hypothetical protein
MVIETNRVTLSSILSWCPKRPFIVLLPLHLAFWWSWLVSEVLWFCWPSTKRHFQVRSETVNRIAFLPFVLPFRFKCRRRCSSSFFHECIVFHLYSSPHFHFLSRCFLFDDKAVCRAVDSQCASPATLCLDLCYSQISRCATSPFPQQLQQ